MQRTGHEWDLHQARRLLDSGSRSYRFTESFTAAPLLEAMTKLSAIGGSEPLAGPHSPPQDHGRKFRMAARGGAAIFSLCYLEQRGYPAKRYGLLDERPEVRDAMANDMVDDSATQPHVFDTGTAAHVRAHPTVRALVSRESLVKLESQAVIGHDTTLSIEKDHAGSKRWQVARDQTHRERLDLASAARVIRHAREECDVLGSAKSGGSRLMARSSGASKPALCGGKSARVVSIARNAIGLGNSSGGILLGKLGGWHIESTIPLPTKRRCSSHRNGGGSRN